MKYSEALRSLPHGTILERIRSNETGIKMSDIIEFLVEKSERISERHYDVYQTQNHPVRTYGYYGPGGYDVLSTPKLHTTQFETEGVLMYEELYKLSNWGANVVIPDNYKSSCGVLSERELRLMWVRCLDRLKTLGFKIHRYWIDHLGNTWNLTISHTLFHFRCSYGHYMSNVTLSLVNEGTPTAILACRKLINLQTGIEYDFYADLFCWNTLEEDVDDLRKFMNEESLKTYLEKYWASRFSDFMARDEYPSMIEKFVTCLEKFDYRVDQNTKFFTNLNI